MGSNRSHGKSPSLMRLCLLPRVGQYCRAVLHSYYRCTKCLSLVMLRLISTIPLQSLYSSDNPAIDVIVPALWFKAGAENDSSFEISWLIILPFPSYAGSQLFDTVKDLSRSKSPAIGEAGELDTRIMPRKVGNGSTEGSDVFPCSPCVLIAGLGTL